MRRWRLFTFLFTVIFIFAFSITVFSTDKKEKPANEKIKSYVSIKKLPHKYDISTASANGDVVRSVNGIWNIDKLDNFIKCYRRSKFDYIRITEYTDEGQPIIQEMVYQNGRLRLTIDTTRDDFGSQSIKSYTVKKIVKSDVKINGNMWIEYRAYLNEKRFICIFIK